MQLSERLCPWLLPHLEQLEASVAAGRFGHGWIVSGPAGVGKLNLALVVADRLLQGTVGSPPPDVFDADGVVAAMRARREPVDHHPDLHLLWPEEGKKAIGIDQVRAATDALGLTAFHGGAKVAVIEPAEAMTLQAANALLKSLEEPAPGTYWLLVSHRIGRLPSTVRSRCQTRVVRRLPGPELESWLGASAAHGAAVLQPLPAPIEAAVRLDKEIINIYIRLRDSLKAISELKTDALTVAEQWVQDGIDVALDWLVEQVQLTIRHRLAPGGTNPVTDASLALSHNRSHLLSLDRLFEQLRDAEALRDRLGSGVNETLALQALLLGFVPQRSAGRPV